MEAKDLAALARLGGRLGDIRTVHENLALAGNVLVQPLAALRARQAALEVVRARLRHGNASDVYARRVDQADAAALDVERIRGEIDRLSLTPPPSDEKTVAVYGFVVDGDRRLSAGEVRLTDGERTLARAAVAKDGSFSLSAPSERPLALSVTARRGGASYSDPAPLNAPGPLPSYRVIDLAGGPPARAGAAKDVGGSSRPESGTAVPAAAGKREAPADRTTPAGAQRVSATPSSSPPKGRTADAVSVHSTPAADVSGATLNQGLKTLGDVGARVSGIRVKNASVGTPQISAAGRDAKSGEVALEVHARDSEAGRLEVLAAVLAHDPTTDPLGMTGVGAVRAWLGESGVKTVDDARAISASSLPELRRRFKISVKAAGLLKEALRGALGKIEYLTEA